MSSGLSARKIFADNKLKRHLLRRGFSETGKGVQKEVIEKVELKRYLLSTSR
jgi:hypothetical protein